MIYPVDSAIQRLNNRGLEVNIVLPNFDLNVFEKEADEEVNKKNILAKKLTTLSKAKN